MVRFPSFQIRSLTRFEKEREKREKKEDRAGVDALDTGDVHRMRAGHPRGVTPAAYDAGLPAWLVLDMRLCSY